MIADPDTIDTIVKFKLVFTKQAQLDAKKIKQANLKSKAEKLLDFLVLEPFKEPPRYKKLLGDLSGAYSRRINYQHRLVYQVIDNQNLVKILRMWTHYE